VFKGLTDPPHAFYVILCAVIV